MVLKRGLILFVFLFIFLIGITSAIGTCDIRLASECATAPFNNAYLSVSALTNAHVASSLTANPYTYALCCDFSTTLESKPFFLG